MTRCATQSRKLNGIETVMSCHALTVGTDGGNSRCGIPAVSDVGIS